MMGSKVLRSGASLPTHALATALAVDGPRLLAFDMAADAPSLEHRAGRLAARGPARCGAARSSIELSLPAHVAGAVASTIGCQGEHVGDLEVFVRQHHAERGLARLGAVAAQHEEDDDG